MKYRMLGSSELNVSEIALGGNTFGQPRLNKSDSIKCIKRAGELGVNFIDTAIIYGGGESECFIGEAIAGQRDKWLVGTKFNFWNVAGNTSVEKHIRHQCEESLRKLKVDYIDLFQLHAPTINISINEVLVALKKLVDEGKVRYVGACNISSWRHAQALYQARDNDLPELVSIQNHYNLLRRHVELETLPYCETENIGFIPYFPLAGGFLTDKYIKGKVAPEGTRGAAGSPIVRHSRGANNEIIQDQLKQWAHQHGHTLSELAIAWLLHQPQVCTVTTGVSTPKQVEDNVRASEWVLTEDEYNSVSDLAAWAGTGGGIEVLEGLSKEPRFAKI